MNGLASGFLGSAMLDAIHCSVSHLPLCPWRSFSSCTSAENHGFFCLGGWGGKSGVCMPPALGLGPTLTPPSTLQFSSLREEKKQQGIMGLIEKENLILRQVMARAPLKPGLGYRPCGLGYHDGQDKVGASSQWSWPSESRQHPTQQTHTGVPWQWLGWVAGTRGSLPPSIGKTW